MEVFLNQIDYATVLDGLATVSALVLILFLLHNRRKYGRIVLNGNAKVQAQFADQVSLHMMTQQSQKAYDNLQQSLRREFESLHLIGEGLVNRLSVEEGSQFTKTAAKGGRERRQRYRLAEEMMIRGDATEHISQRCGLMEGEIALLRGLQQMAQERVHAL